MVVVAVVAAVVAVVNQPDFGQATHPGERKRAPAKLAISNACTPSRTAGTN